MAIFQKSVIKKHLNNLDKEQVEKAYLKFKSNYSPAKIKQIKILKEEEYQDGFLRDIFVDVFGYTLRPEENYNLQREFKNQTDGKKADAAILSRGLSRGLNPLEEGKAIAVIELKSTKTKDLTKITQQAFNYKNNQPECKYVITSNFQKLRFYIDYANEYEEFDLFHLEKEDFELLYLLLSKKSIFDNLPLKLKEETKFHEQEVSSKLYKDYSHFKRNLYENLVKNHPENNKLILFKKSQKLLDRFLFILFAEDSGLLPPNSISRVIDTYHKLIELDSQKSLYAIFKQYFGYMNIGRKGKTNSGDIPAYNGGLFYEDGILDNLIIDDKILIDDLRNLSEYDFNTEVDVNILGHLFEHSLNEIEEITAEIEATATTSRGLNPLESPLKSPLKISKRKKDGVFYTPKYITQYIVENTIGTLCNEKRMVLDIEEIEFDGTYKTKSGKLSEKGKKLYQKLKAYKEWLISLKIIDPACGSGAFLNQALNFLIKEHTIIDDIIAELTNTPLRLFDVDKSILENNLFGVDINEESVEIAQLSLWLRTAQKGRKLSNLNNNIKCGNSLIDDPKIAGEKAFHWQTEFPQVFKEKDKKAYHITTAIHDSRTSARMIKYKVRENREMGTNPYPNIIYFTKEDDLLITQTVAEIVKEDKLDVLAYNICADHIHLLLVCDIDEIPSIMHKIKGRTSYVYKGLKPLEERKKSKPLWQQKYSAPKEITSQEQLDNTINYIQKNRSKHELPEHSDTIKLLIQNMCTDYITATQKTDYFGGFDCVIGNPPYVNMANIQPSEIRNYLQRNYETVKNKSDLYSIFIEKGVNLCKKGGSISYITPNSWLGTDSFSKLRKYLINNTNVYELIKLPPSVFKDAIVTTLIISIKNNSVKDNEILLKSYLNNEFKFLNHTLSYQKIRSIKSFTFSFDKNISINTKINLEDIAKFSLGIKSSDDKRFISSKPFVEDNYPLLRGRNISKYYYNQPTDNIWYRPDLMKERKGSGPRNLNLFKGDKILIQDISKSINSTYCSEFILTNDTINIIYELNKDYSFKFITLILNSNLINFWFKRTFPEGLHIKINQLKNIPIKEISKENQQPFIEKATKMLALNQELQIKSAKFLNRVQEHFTREHAPLRQTTVASRGLTTAVVARGLNPLKITKKLNAFYNFDFKTFVAELKKQKIVLSLKQQDEWQDYFDSYKTELNQLQKDIQQTNNEIDQMVYELYGLNEDEIKIVEKSIQ